MENKKGIIQQVGSVTVTIALLLAGGCATNGTLSAEKITQGERAIAEARQSNASLSAPVEVKTAEDKIAEARTALVNKKYGKAARLAEEAQVDADYARAKADSEKAKKTAEEMRQNIQTLRQEIERLSKQ
jgi:chromosome segregation ATPase